MFSSLLKKKNKLLPEEEFYQNAGRIPGGFATSKKVWVAKPVNGDVICTGHLLIEKDAEIRGDVFCKRGHIKGKVLGSVYAWEELVIEGEAVVAGNITAHAMNVDQGALIKGKISMPVLVAIPARVLDIDWNTLDMYDRSESPNPAENPPVTMKQTPVTLPIPELVKETVPAQAAELASIFDDLQKPVSREKRQEVLKEVVTADSDQNHWW